MISRFLIPLALVVLWIGSTDPAAAEPTLNSIQESIQQLQAQLAANQKHSEEQARLIEEQGRQIAALRVRLEQAPGGTTVQYAPPQDPATLKQHVRGVLQEFRLTERQDVPENDQLITLYDDGFYLKGKDDTLRIGGWYQGDFNAFDRGNEANARFRNRRVRLDLRGVLEDDFEYRLFSQFAGSSANLQEAWLGYRHFPDARLKFGQFKVPFSLESQYSSLWTDFMEKSVIVANLEPAEDVGAMVYGNPWGGAVEYAAGAFNGRARTLEDNNDNSDLAGRLVAAPWKSSEAAALKDLYIGGSFTTGHSDETLAGGGFTTASGNRFLTYASGARHANNRTRLGGELQWIYGPGDIKAEYVGARFSDVERPGISEDVDVQGWYASWSHILTGEKKPRNKVLVPRKNFSLKENTWGAWEVGTRFEQFFVDSSVIDKGLATGTDRVDSVTAALNWWLNRHVRLMFNYTYNRFEEPILIANEAESAEHLFLTRVQYNF